jgi:hypothetical protein
MLPLVTSGVMLPCPLFRRCIFTIRTDMLFKFRGRRFGVLATSFCRCHFVIATTISDGWRPHLSDERPTAAAGTAVTATRRGGQQGGVCRGRSQGRRIRHVVRADQGASSPAPSPLPILLLGLLPVPPGVVEFAVVMVVSSVVAALEM